jgi:hypothetical protein
MKFICIYCRKFVKRKQTTVNLELERVKTSNVHIEQYHRHCIFCNNEIYDAKLETKNIKRYVKEALKQEAKNAK